MQVKVKIKGNKIKVQSNVGYYPEVKNLMVLENNGNGYYVKTQSYTSVEADHLFNLDYSEIEYLYFAYKAILEKGDKNEES